MMKNMPRNNWQWLGLAILALLALALIVRFALPGDKSTGAQQAGSGIGNATNVVPSPASGVMPTEALPASVTPEAGKKAPRKRLVHPEPDVPASAVAVVKPPAPRQAVVYGLPALPEEDKQPSANDNVESFAPKPR